MVLLIIMGVGQMLAAKGFSAWGFLLIVIGLASYYFSEASMFMVYAATIIWAGINNIFNGPGVWTIFAFVQFYLGFTIFQQFRRYRKVEQEQRRVQRELSRSERFFPWIAAIFGVLSILFYGGMWLGILTVVALKSASSGSWILDFLFVLGTIGLYLGIIGMATGLAAWVGAFPRKWLAITGTCAAGLTLLASLLYVLFSKL
jgi:hypothetical protein